MVLADSRWSSLNRFVPGIVEGQAVQRAIMDGARLIPTGKPGTFCRYLDGPNRRVRHRLDSQGHAGSAHDQSGHSDAVESVFVKHVSGGVSELGFKSYDGGREVFQGTSRQCVWLDEEPPEESISKLCFEQWTATEWSCAPSLPSWGWHDVPEILPAGRQPGDSWCRSNGTKCRI